MQRPDRETLDLLAGEYVLGTLAGPARARFERWIETDPEVRELVDAWEARLASLAEDVPEQAPSPAVWDGVARELGHAPKEAAGPRKVTRRQFWFGFGSATAAASVIGGMAGLLAWPEASFAYPSHYALLRDKDQKPVWLVAIHDGHGHYQVHPIDGRPTPPADHERHLWLGLRGGGLVPLGVIKAGRAALPDAARGRLDSATMAITHEPRTTSPSAPSGPAVYQGAIFRAR